MNRCRICDVIYQWNTFERFQDEGYCPLCAGEISLCLEELEDLEEMEDEDGYQ